MANDNRDKAIKKLSKQLADDLRESFSRLVPRLHIMSAVDPTFVDWLNQYEGLAAASRFMHKKHGISIDEETKTEIKSRLGQLPTERRPLKCMRREVKAELCTLVEAIQIVRALDETVEVELAEYGANVTFDCVKDMHIKRVKKIKREHEEAAKRRAKECAHMARE